MRANSLSFEAIEAALLEDNRKRCEPPLSDDDVRKIARQAAKYPPGHSGARPIVDSYYDEGIDKWVNTLGDYQGGEELPAPEIRSAFEYLGDFKDKIKASIDTPAIPTGFPALDEKLDGGLYEGLYIIGAISSLGKTTFALQIGDYVAQHGTNALIFSLEMSRFELMSKSISRLTAIRGAEMDGHTRNAKTARGITTLAKYEGYSPREHELIGQAIGDYAEYARNLCIIEAMGDIGVSNVRKIISAYIENTGKKPVVILDYLQIMKPSDPRSTDKQNTDRAVTELKRISRDHKMPIIAISSLNRANYDEDISMAAFKESGAVEYSSDVLIGLQLDTGEAKRTKAAINAAKIKNPRPVELVTLKNRNGVMGYRISFKYYSALNLFEEIGENQRAQKTEQPDEPLRERSRRRKDIDGDGE
jgi:replicative DNA helicase